MSFKFSCLFDKEISSIEKETGYTIAPYAEGMAYVSAAPPDASAPFLDYISTNESGYHLWQIIGVDRKKNIYILQDGRILRQINGMDNLQLIVSSLKCSEIADISVNRDGLVLCVGYNPNEFDLVPRITPQFSTAWSKMERKPRRLPFWETGANCIFAAPEYFAVGRSEFGSVDFYTYSGDPLRSIDEFILNGAHHSLREEYITRIFIDKNENTWLTNDIDVFIFDKHGNAVYMSSPQEFSHDGTHIEFSRLFGVDKDKGLWGTWHNRPIRLTT